MDGALKSVGDHVQLQKRVSLSASVLVTFFCFRSLEINLKWEDAQGFFSALKILNLHPQLRLSRTEIFRKLCCDSRVKYCPASDDLLSSGALLKGWFNELHMRQQDRCSYC